MEDCPKNLSKSEIISDFGKSDDMGACNTCNNLIYEHGIMLCRLMLEGEGNDN